MTCDWKVSWLQYRDVHTGMDFAMGFETEALVVKPEGVWRARRTVNIDDLSDLMDPPSDPDEYDPAVTEALESPADEPLDGNRLQQIQEIACDPALSGGHFRLSDRVGDEGEESEALVVDADGRRVVLEFLEGSGYPRSPARVGALYHAVTGLRVPSLNPPSTPGGS